MLKPIGKLEQRCLLVHATRQGLFRALAFRDVMLNAHGIEKLAVRCRGRRRIPTSAQKCSPLLR